MSDKGYFSGFSWHTEFHTVDKKKNKAADCIFLTEDRICTCKKSVYFTEKCFSATYCPHRQKENIPEQNIVAAKQKIVTNKTETIINCTLPMNCSVYSKKWGNGEYILFEKAKKFITISFDGKEVKFMYPNAFLDKHLLISDQLMEIVQKDITNAKKG